MKKKVIRMALAAIAAVSLTSGCNNVFEVESVSNEPGTTMVFGASGGWRKDPGTRTEYSGKDEDDLGITKDSEWERIDWVVNLDKIRVLCDAAVGKANPSDKKADYSISERNTGTDKKKSEARILPADNNSLHWGTDEHYIYALYPAPGTESNYSFTNYNPVSSTNSQIESLTGNKARITGVIPAAQEVVRVGNIFRPNMNYAYMYAATKATPGVPGTVTLSFQPLVTALEISLKAFDNVMAGKDLVSLKLTTTGSSYLTGSFKADLDCDNTTTPFTIATTNTVTPGREITVTFPTGTRLSETDKSVVTVLALGLQQTDLTLTLTFSGNVTRTLALNTKVNNVSTPVSIGACRKGYINLEVPSDTYVLGTLSPETVAYGGSSSASLGSGFVSYLQQGSHTVPVKFRLEYSEANPDGTCAGVWNYTPDWVDDTGIDFNGSVNGQNLPITIAHSPEVHTKRLYDATPKEDFDLSRVNVARGTIAESGKGTSANCYVVQASGTYKFPVVYGNCLQKGSTTSNDPRYAHAPHDADVEGVDPNDSNRKGYYLGRFLDHLNAGIGGPYIGSLYANYTLAAALLWTDVDGLIESVQYNVASNRNQDYISFTVPRATIRQGNALIAVTVDGVIAWSWHIWVTDTDLSQPIAGPTATFSTDPDPKAYEFAPVNLGWCDKETYEERKCYVRAVQVDGSGNTITGGQVSEPVLITQEPSDPSYGGNNPYYQWGRKDPLEATSGNGNQGKQYYGTHQPTFAAVSSINTLGYAIQHPNVFYYEVGEVYDSWCAQYHYYNLWNYNVVTRGLSAESIWTPVGKTIYDPCPVGYSVPPATAFTGLNNENFPLVTDSDSNKARIYNNTLWFPNIGTVGSSHANVGSETRYWSASPDSPGNMYRGVTLKFTNTSVTAPSNNFRSAGFPIRPVRRDATDSVQ